MSTAACAERSVDNEELLKEENDQAPKPDDAIEVEEGELPDSPAPPEEEEEEKDPPVLPLHQYSREQLMLIKTYPLSQKRPDCLDSSFNSCLKMPVTSNSSRGVWDPERWHLDKRGSETPPDEVAQGNNMGDPHKRRSGDPRERIRKEQDGIVLSPQRRSFNSGCFVTQAQPPLVRRPESPIGKADRDRDASHREIPTRRIGSGRILARERDSWGDFRLDRDKEPESGGVDSFNSFQRGSAGGGGREREGERFERRSFTRERDFGQGEKAAGGRQGAGKWERRRYDSREEEPEWFSAGPTSQHDTIELRGFDEMDEQPPGTRGPKKQANNAFKNSNGKTITRLSLGRKVDAPPAAKAATAKTSPPPPAAKEEAAGPVRPPSADRSPPGGRRSATPTHDKRWPAERETGDEQLAADYNFLDDFLKGDALPHLLSQNGTEVEGNAGSRFSRYFHRESPPNKSDSRRSSLHDEMLKNMINDFADPSIAIPAMGASEAYFAPISPAANSAIVRPAARQPQDGHSQQQQQPPLPNTLLQMLHRGQGDGGKAPSIKSLAPGKIQSVEELEARMRQQGIGAAKNVGPPAKAPPKKSDEDLAAFAKLLGQVSGQKAAPRVASNGPVLQQAQPISLMEMFNKSHGGGDSLGGPPSDQQAINLLASFPAAAGQSQPPQQQQPAAAQQPQQPMHVPQDLVLKLLHVQQQQQRQQQQQDMLNKLMASNQQQKSSSRLVPGPPFQAPPPSLSPLPFDVQQIIHGVQPNRELMQRPEAQAILHGMQNGEITSQNVMQQLQNPAMQPRHREVLTHILKMHHNSSRQRQTGPSPRTVSPHVVQPPQQQQLQHPDMLQQMLLQQQTQQHTQQQLRIPSPLNSAYCAPPPPIISPNPGNNPHTLSVQHPAMPRRVPSPRELIVHTQNIMQSALIKKKLEEQRENFLKRQVQQSVSPNTMATGGAMGNGPVKMGDAPPPQSKNVASPTPLAFTPTSVMRKMTAEKDSEPGTMGMSTSRPELKLQMNQQAFGMPPSVQQQQQQQHRSQAASAQQLPLLSQLSRAQQLTAQTMQMAQQVQQQQAQQTGSTWIPPTAKLPAGRPIVKGTANFQPFSGGSMDFPTPQTPLQPPHRTMHPGGGYAGTQSRSQMPMSNPPPSMAAPAGINPLMMMYRPQQQQQQQQQQQMNQATNRGPSQKVQPHLVSMQQQQNMGQSLQQMLHNQNYGNANRSSSNDPGLRHHSQPISMRQSQGMMRTAGGDVSTSPTSNQLAQWFSPELLAQAKAGQLAGMPAISTMQNMLSLEDLERLQQATAAAAQLST